MMKKFILILSLLIIMGCVSKQRETELLDRITELEKQLDECQHGAEKMRSQFLLLYKSKNYDRCKEVYSEMKERHPESDHFPEIESLHNKIIKEEAKEAKQKKVQAEKEKQAKLKSLNKLRKKYDDVSGVTWYRNPYFVHYNNTNLVSLYIGSEGNSHWLRLKMSYQGDDWIFFEKAYLSYDGHTKEVFFDRYKNKETENSGGGVWEWIDISVSKELEIFLYSFAQSKNAKMRLTGKYSETRKLIWNERQGMRDVLNGYEVLGQGIK